MKTATPAPITSVQAGFEVEPYRTGAFAEQMFAQYGEAYFSGLLNGVKEAPLAHQPDQTVNYTRFGTGEKVFVVPGFTENIIGKAVLGLELAKQGYDVTLPHYNSADVVENPGRLNRRKKAKKDAAYTKALDHLAVIENEGLTNEPLKVITHSYGSLVFQAMQKVASERGWKCFQDSEVSMLSPAGFKKHEWALGLGLRFARFNLQEAKSIKESPDQDKLMQKASMDSVLANKKRALREIIDVKSRRVDLKNILWRGVKHISVFGFAEDALFPHKVIAPEVGRMMDQDQAVSYSVPISYKQRPNGEFVGIKGSTHNDDSFSPRRVVGAVKADWDSRKPAQEPQVVPVAEVVAA